MAKPLTPCGTYAGYARHRKAAEPACGPCKAAAAEARREQRATEPYVIPDLPNLPEALCREVDPELWVPSSVNAAANTAQHRKAAAICAICPEREPCLEYALSFPVRQIAGTWGGTTQDERQELRRQRAEAAA